MSRDDSRPAAEGTTGARPDVRCGNGGLHRGHGRCAFVRAAGRDENIILSPPAVLTLESAMELIRDDELVEITPTSIRIRKRHLKENERKRVSRRTA